jgi:hypothetical protein
MANLPRILFAVLCGIAAGGVAHFTLLAGGQRLISLPAGFNTSHVSTLAAASPLEPRHFLFPFLAHATGTLVGAAVAWSLAGERRAHAGYAVAALFLVGGLTAAQLTTVPPWFVAVDLPLAYFPMAWLGNRIGHRLWLARA